MRRKFRSSLFICFCIAPPATNVIRQGSKALPTLDERKKPNGDNRAGSKGATVIDKERIINIDTLNPYMNKLVFVFFDSNLF